MRRKLSVYYTVDHASITVQNGASRETTATSMPEALRAMHPDDLGVLVAWCRAVTTFVDSDGAENTFKLVQVVKAG